MSEIQFGTFTDSRDGRVYKTVKIGNQEWFAENFAYKSDDSAAYNDDEINVEKYGRLYSRDAAVDCAPDGWHLPNKKEAELLLTFLKKSEGLYLDSHVTPSSSIVQNISENGIDEDLYLKTILKSKTDDWKDAESKGSDKYGFNALPAGGYSRSRYENLGEKTRFWLSTVEASTLGLSYLQMELDSSSCGLVMGVFDPKNKWSVRYVKGPKPTGVPVEYGTFTDPRDGHVYKTVKIGEDELFVDNLAYKCKNGNEGKYTIDDMDECTPDGWYLPNSMDFCELINMKLNDEYNCVEFENCTLWTSTSPGMDPDRDYSFDEYYTWKIDESKEVGYEMTLLKRTTLQSVRLKKRTV